MRFSLTVLRQRRGADANVQNVATDLREGIQANDTAPCLNPACTETCHWKRGAGRPPLFHSRGCRERYDRERARLLAEVRLIDEALNSGEELSRADRPYLRSEAARRRWLLERYQWEPGGNESDLHRLGDGAVLSGNLKKSQATTEKRGDSRKSDRAGRAGS